MARLVYGKGVNDANYATQRAGEKWICPFYLRWVSMLRRCYSAYYQKMRPTYVGCSVAEEWLLFSNFRAWMITQNWVGKELDKDILFPGNKVYSEETCVFVDTRINSFILDNESSRGDYPVGVYLRKGGGKYCARIHDGSGKQKHLGSFETPEAAYTVWLTEKKKMAKLLASQQSDQRIADALLQRYN